MKQFHNNICLISVYLIDPHQRTNIDDAFNIEAVSNTNHLNIRNANPGHLFRRTSLKTKQFKTTGKMMFNFIANYW